MPRKSPELTGESAAPEPVEIVARALAVAAHKHLLGSARWEKWMPDAKYAIEALRAAGYEIALRGDSQ